jgi:hypothetical protein
MKPKIIPILISTSLVYVIFIILGFSFFDDYSGHVIISTGIFFFVLCYNFFWLNWKDKIISNFIVEKNLTFLFLILAFLNFVGFLAYFFLSEGLDRIMICSACIGYTNTCICIFIYLKE